MEFIKKAIRSLKEINDYIKYFPSISPISRFNKTKIDVKHVTEFGRSTYNFKS